MLGLNAITRLLKSLDMVELCSTDLKSSHTQKHNKIQEMCYMTMSKVGVGNLVFNFVEKIKQIDAKRLCEIEYFLIL
jgi:hypothetical protein